MTKPKSFLPLGLLLLRLPPPALQHLHGGDAVRREAVALHVVPRAVGGLAALAVAAAAPEVRSARTARAAHAARAARAAPVPHEPGGRHDLLGPEVEEEPDILAGGLPECGREGVPAPLDVRTQEERQDLGRHHLSNATCLIRPHVFYALFVVSRITIICYMIRHF